MDVLSHSVFPSLDHGHTHRVSIIDLCIYLQGVIFSSLTN